MTKQTMTRRIVAMMMAVGLCAAMAQAGIRAVAVYICQGPHLFPSRTQ